jgi:hypothetical protein
VSGKAGLVTTCVQSTVAKIHALMKQARPIKFDTFARRTNWTPIAQQLGYSVGAEPGLHLRDDYCVRFYRSRWEGRRCYVMQWSAIEHVFVAGGAL